MGLPRVLLLPGVVTPAAVAFADLLTALGDGVDAHAQDLEVYATPEPPAGYSLDLEVDAVLRSADARGWDSFHLLGFSGGGAVALATTAAHGDRLSSLALVEPAWAGNGDDASAAHRALWPEYARVAALPAADAMAAFVTMQLRPGVVPPPPPPGPPPAWMAQRPAGMRAMVDAFRAHDLDVAALGRFDRPVYFALGGLSNPDQFGDEARRLADVFGDFRLDVFPDRHHFDPPHRAQAEDLAASLLSLWRRADPT